MARDVEVVVPLLLIVYSDRVVVAAVGDPRPQQAPQLVASVVVGLLSPLLPSAELEFVVVAEVQQRLQPVDDAVAAAVGDAGQPWLAYFWHTKAVRHTATWSLRCRSAHWQLGEELLVLAVLIY